MTVIAAFLVGCNEYKLTQYEDVEEEGEDTAVEPLPELELQPPVALAAVGDQIKRMETITLNGSASYDPDGMNEPLIYSWEVSEYPDGANITFADSNTATPSFSADVLGTYVVTLTVTDIDGLVSENLAGTVIEVIAWENLIAILDWDTDELDLDLHMLSPTGSYYGDGDCYYGNPTPDWGEEGVSTDDPSLDSDQESAGEPETITLWQPEEGTYTFYVHYFNPRDAETTWTWPTLEVYAEGDLVAALEGPRLATEGMVWEAGELDWTTLEYTESSSTSTHEAMGGPAVNEKE